MLKRIPPKTYGRQAEPQVPLQERISRLMARIHSGGRLWPYADEATVKECIRRGLIRKGRMQVHSRMARTTLIPLVPAPAPVVERVAQPYAKRNADLDAAGLHRRVTPSAPRQKP